MTRRLAGRVHEVLCRSLPFYGARLATLLSLGYLGFAVDAGTLSADFASFAMTIPAARMLELFKARAEFSVFWFPFLVSFAGLLS